MAHTNVIHKSPISSQSPEISPESPICMPKNRPRAHMPSEVDSIDCFEHIVEKLVRTLKKLNVKNKIKNAKLKIQKHVIAKKPKIRASKLKYKLIDEMYIDSFVTTISLMSLT